MLAVLAVWSSAGGAGTSGRGIGMAIKDAKGQAVGGYDASYALLIGVSDYTAGWPDLEAIPGELETVGRALKAQGFQVERALDPDSRTLERAIGDFIDRHGYDGGNRLLIYYSGHGYTLDGGTRGYLVPSDAPNPEQDEKGFRRKALDMNLILAYSRQATARHILFLFDSCFSGAIFKQRDLPKAPPHISAMTAQPVRQFITAGSAGETVPARSTFTPVFVDAVEHGLGDLNRDGYVSGTELGLYLQEKVPRHARQTPQYGKISDYELSRGDFILLAGGAAVVEESGKAAASGALRVDTQPGGATVWINGVRKGAAPVDLKDLPPGQVTVKADKGGYVAEEKQVWVRPGKRATVTLLLSPESGLVQVTSTPPGAEWYLDGGLVGKTPDEMAGVALGRHRVTVKQAGYEDWSGTVDVGVGKTARVFTTLTKRVETYALTVNPEPSEARVRILNIGPPYRPGMKLAPGNYHIEVSAPGYTTHTEWVRIADGARHVSVSLERAGGGVLGGAGEVFRDRLADGGEGPEMVAIPGGTFMMGSPAGEGLANEHPQHRVNVSAFAIGKYEVTFAEYDRFARAMGRELPDDGGLGRGKRPVIYVEWADATAYAAWLSEQTGEHYRLPAEAEWEYAARAGTRTKYPWGDEVGRNHANCDGCGSRWDNEQTAPVGSFAANDFGLYDMAGNVWEWTADCWNDSYRGAPSNGSAWTRGECDLHVLRGGSWADVPAGARSAARGYGLDFRVLVGLRLARTL